MTSMEALLGQFAASLAWPLLLGLMVLALLVLVGGANLFVSEAVALSRRWGVSTAVIGATLVSLGTTSPEAMVSVQAALQGNPGLALGNAVGSIICDTGLVLGLGALIAPLAIDRSVVNRQGWIQLGAGLLLVVACVPWAFPARVFVDGGRLPQWMGCVFLGLLAVYLWKSISWSKNQQGQADHVVAKSRGVPFAALLLFVLGAAMLVGGSSVFIPSIKEIALRLQVPDSIIAATLVAFGTSLPELCTVVTAAWKGHGELAIGNVIGADILNVLFVAGASAAVTQGGLVASAEFFRLLFPAMIILLLVFRIGVTVSKHTLGRSFGLVLLGAYGLVTVLSYV